MIDKNEVLRRCKFKKINGFHVCIQADTLDEKLANDEYKNACTFTIADVEMKMIPWPAYWFEIDIGWTEYPIFVIHRNVKFGRRELFTGDDWVIAEFSSGAGLLQPKKDNLARLDCVYDLINILINKGEVDFFKTLKIYQEKIVKAGGILNKFPE